ncbi:hypothetical protein AX774_g1719 [Zancudomyces culisetae]|uniref:Pentatricopeptide repeat-containing protein n=1 Tax=Zancudomyces culisetae TaxID=1213189 RepID=A0A1R1PUV8_ZANCU|nr:hypothetical protein AX774_g1719 [Zancudomyces culisetae]|eukprot:OMH84755.1 hypothetical protein AX774_g1719 [Zancudomyces culisetae]
MLTRYNGRVLTSGANVARSFSLAETRENEVEVSESHGKEGKSSEFLIEKDGQKLIEVSNAINLEEVVEKKTREWRAEPDSANIAKIRGKISKVRNEQELEEVWTNDIQVIVTDSKQKSSGGRIKLNEAFLRMLEQSFEAIWKYGGRKKWSRMVEEILDLCFSTSIEKVENKWEKVKAIDKEFLQLVFFVKCKALHVYAKKGDVVRAEAIFEELLAIKEYNGHGKMVYTNMRKELEALIVAYAVFGDLKRAEDTKEFCKKLGMDAEIISGRVALIKEYSRREEVGKVEDEIRELKDAFRLHNESIAKFMREANAGDKEYEVVMNKKKRKANSISGALTGSGNMLLHIFADNPKYSMEKVLKRYEKIFEDIKENLTTQNIVIQAMLLRDKEKEANEWLEKMREKKMKPDIVTITLWVGMLVRKGKFWKMHTILQTAKEAGLEESQITKLVIMTGRYGRNDILGIKRDFWELVKKVREPRTKDSSVLTEIVTYILSIAIHDPKGWALEVFQIMELVEQELVYDSDNIVIDTLLIRLGNKDIIRLRGEDITKEIEKEIQKYMAMETPDQDQKTKTCDEFMKLYYSWIVPTATKYVLSIDEVYTAMLSYLVSTKKYTMAKWVYENTVVLKGKIGANKKSVAIGHSKLFEYLALEILVKYKDEIDECTKKYANPDQENDTAHVSRRDQMLVDHLTRMLNSRSIGKYGYPITTVAASMASTNYKDLNITEDLYSYIINNYPTLANFTALLEILSEKQEATEFEIIWHLMKTKLRIDHDSSSYLKRVKLYYLTKDHGKVWKVYKEMENRGVRVIRGTMLGFVTGSLLVSRNYVSIVKLVHYHLLVGRVSLNTLTLNNLMMAISKNNTFKDDPQNMLSAFELFYKMFLVISNCGVQPRDDNDGDDAAFVKVDGNDSTGDSELDDTKKITSDFYNAFNYKKATQEKSVLDLLNEIINVLKSNPSPPEQNVRESINQGTGINVHADESDSLKEIVPPTPNMTTFTYMMKLSVLLEQYKRSSQIFQIFYDVYHQSENGSGNVKGDLRPNIRFLSYSMYAFFHLNDLETCHLIWKLMNRYDLITDPYREVDFDEYLYHSLRNTSRFIS